MIIKVDIPWERYALIVELAERLQEKSPQFGKTALQKVVYLLQECYRINCGYTFDLYTYGPFASQLLQDLDVVEHVGAVVVHPITSPPGGYEIRPGEAADSLRQKGSAFLGRTDVKEAISGLVDEFGSQSAKDLELRSTIIYVHRELMLEEGHAPADKVFDIVKEIKPKFPDMEIHAAIEEMKKRSCIKLDR